jgi:hypothetical protein
MKIFFAAAIIFVFVFLACDNGSTSDIGSSGNNDEINFTTLKIKNEAFIILENVKWQGVSFTAGYYDYIAPGENREREVEAGSGYIFFTSYLNFRTKDVVIIENNENKEFTFNDNTAIIEITSNIEIVLKDLY